MARNIYEDLKERGFIYQNTDEENVSKFLEKEKLTFYAGFDPTGSSLHVGHLLPIMAMRRLQQAGHTPIVLVGGATALVGDPSGKQEARPILTKDEVAANVEALKAQLGRFISVENAIFVNNADWFQHMGYLDFLREIGCRFSVNKMLAAESVKLRLETGLSFLEFNYMLLQAYDYYILNSKYDCRLELGGQDQWGNIVAGVELVRKMSQKEVYGVTFPLLLDGQGQKFGKTAGGAVWLDSSRTSIFEYYQFWRNAEDSDVSKLLCFFTNLPVEEIKELSSLEAPRINRAKEILAFEATALAHGEDEAAKAYLAAGGRFGFADPEQKIDTSSRLARVKVESAAENLPSYTVPVSALGDAGIWVVKLFSDAGLCSSNGEARRLISGGGAYINEERIGDINMNIVKEHFASGPIILKAGKKNIRRVSLG
ncbi:MAG: tyrosine--tRNA ligase [Lentisphaerae bacterium GWF2_45_14]|nr:MAG: tyrosine--tRNA ligase [Lentisphaerae bacterium GWF2_45_14]